MKHYYSDYSDFVILNSVPIIQGALINLNLTLDLNLNLNLNLNLILNPPNQEVTLLDLEINPVGLVQQLWA